MYINAQTNNESYSFSMCLQMIIFTANNDPRERMTAKCSKYEMKWNVCVFAQSSIGSQVFADLCSNKWGYSVNSELLIKSFNPGSRYSLVRPLIHPSIHLSVSLDSVWFCCDKRLMAQHCCWVDMEQHVLGHRLCTFSCDERYVNVQWFIC